MTREDDLCWQNWFDQLSINDYVVIDNFLTTKELKKTIDYFQKLNKRDKFAKAAIGSSGNEHIISEIRGDYIYWLDADKDNEMIEVFDTLTLVKRMINRYCFLSLSDYEFHFAYYPSGGFYKKHLDQFSNRNNRMISMIIYLNENWKNGDGGELKIYPNNSDSKTIEPILNRCILFKSDTLLHEVLKSNKPRKSLTGWMLYQPSPLIGVTP